MPTNKSLVDKILAEGYLMSLGVADNGGPWVSDVIYVYDNRMSIFWLSEIKTRHSQAIIKNGKASATITISNQGDQSNVGLQIEGAAEKIDGENYDLTVKHWTKRKKQIPLPNEKIVDDEKCWWKLTPTKIEIIYEPLWGFKKKVLEL
jgi:uncharacterized protein YhbP (UPF0306 family)